MTKYRVTFVETVKYEVEFESELSKKQLADPDGVHLWFQVMDEAVPDWYSGGHLGVEMRELIGLEIVP